MAVIDLWLPWSKGSKWAGGGLWNTSPENASVPETLGREWTFFEFV